MLNLINDRRYSNCEGATRRDFIKVGALGATGLGLADLLAERARAVQAGRPTKNTAVVWLWLSGGPTHVETFDPKMTAPVEYRSTTGEVATNIPGVSLGGTFPKLATLADKLAIVRSFAHTNSGHGGGTHWVMTGYDSRDIDNGGLPTRPAIGSILSRIRGANNRETGIPTYIRLGSIRADGPAFLGTAYAPFDPAGDARKNMNLAISASRLDDRRELLGKIDRLNRDADRSGLMDGMTDFERQAFKLITSDSLEAFDVNKEDPKVLARYKNGPGNLAQQMLLARRLCEVGCGFVTLNYGSWDMHSGIKSSMERRGPELDHAVATFIQDVHDRGLQDEILLVVTGEFGRTPKINARAGRDHWAPLSTLALSGGGLQMGQVVGESMPKLDVPKSNPIRPADLMATVLEVLGIDPKRQFLNQAGRPVTLVENGSLIGELV